MRQEEVLKALRELGPSTAKEITTHIRGRPYDRVSLAEAHNRLYTLLRQGFVRKIGERPKEKGAGGRPSPIWEVVE